MSACRECGCKDGDRGPQGPAGAVGATGPAGDVGATGPQGPKGDDGIQGIQGDQGSQGPQGPSGSNITGPAGPTGPQGDTGIDGPQGNDGADGADGTDGANGQGQITWSIDATVGAATVNPVANSGLILKNTGGLLTIELPLGSLLGDLVSVAGTIYGTGGWKLKAQGTETIQMTSVTPLDFQTSGGGEVVIGPNNFNDVVHLLSDGLGAWIIVDKIFANGTIPLFT